MEEKEEIKEIKKIEKEEIIRSSEIIKFETIKKTIEQMEKCICNVRFDVSSQTRYCTGFFCKIPFPNYLFPVLITSNPTNENENLSEKIEKIGINIKEKEIKLINLKNRIKYSSKKYKTFIIEIKEEDDINNYLEIDNLMLNDLKNFNCLAYIKNEIHIIQYSNIKELAISYGYLYNINEERNYEFYHSCGTNFGSSGSPIFNNYNKIIGIHSGSINKEKYNFGIF